MKNNLLFLILSILIVFQGCKKSETKEQKTDNETFKSDTTRAGVQWFPDAKFGIFVHWLLYDKNQKKENENELSFKDEAIKEANLFTAEKYNPKEWAKLFKSWGARYVVLTTKHHIGFALYDCPGHEFSAANSSPAKRDLVKEYVEAIRAEGLKVGFYFSLPDWTNPDYASIQCPEGKKDCNDRAYGKETDTVKWNRFVKQMHKEVRHLCTAYGKVDLFWFDGDWERKAEQWKSIELAKMIDSLQPDAVINNRLKHINLGHYGTPEQSVPLSPRKGWWELCMTPGDNWDGIGASTNIKPVSHLVRTFSDVVGMNGNLLLNVAPDPDGTISKQQIDTISKLAKWITSHSEAIFDTKAALPLGLFNGSATRKGSVIYLFAYDQPRDQLVLKGTNSEVKKVTHLLTGDELKWTYSGGFKGWSQKGWLYIQVPPKYMDKYATVVKIEFVGDSVKFKNSNGQDIRY